MNKGKQSGIHTGKGVKTPKLKFKGGSTGKAKHQGVDGASKGKSKHDY